jgi:hypothetical protein
MPGLCIIDKAVNPEGGAINISRSKYPSFNPQRKVNERSIDGEEPNCEIGTSMAS